MNIISYFTNRGQPANLLTPTITIYRIYFDNTVTIEVDAAAMTEISDGGYSYYFENFIHETQYYIVCDGGPTLSEYDRYAITNNSVIEHKDTIVANFTFNGLPATGLTPLATVYNVNTKTKIFDNKPMQEIGQGGYVLTDPALKSAIYCIIDGGSHLPLSERYVFVNYGTYGDSGGGGDMSVFEPLPEPIRKPKVITNNVTVIQQKSNSWIIPGSVKISQT